MTKYEITIRNNRKPITQVLLASFGLSVGLFGPIALGILLQSAAMQWAGFVIGMFIFISVATVFDKTKIRVTSIEDARKALDKIQAMENTL